MVSYRGRRPVGRHWFYDVVIHFRAVVHFNSSVGILQIWYHYRIGYIRFCRLDCVGLLWKVRTNAGIRTSELSTENYSGFFSKAARHIYTFREAAFRRRKRIKDHIYFTVISDDIIRSHCPTYMPRPYGARTRISSCAVIGLIDPPLFFLYCKTHFNLSIDQAEIFAEQLDKAQDPVITNDGTVLYQPYLIICHGTRYKENSLTGLTRLLGIGNFGEFATFSFEQINQTLIRELKRKHKTYTSEDIFAEYKDICVLGILRIYSTTKIGKRPQKYSLHIVSPEKDIGLNMDQLRQAAQKRYHFRVD